MARTLEAKLDDALQAIEISATLIRQGRESRPADRLRFMASYVEEAIELQKRIEKRNARQAV